MKIRERLTEASCVMLKYFIIYEEKTDLEIAQITGQKGVNVRAQMTFFDLMGWGKKTRQRGNHYIRINPDIIKRARQEGIVNLCQFCDRPLTLLQEGKEGVCLNCQQGIYP